MMRAIPIVPVGAGGILAASAIGETIYQSYLAALLNGDRPVCGAIVRELCAAGAGVKDLYLNLFQRSLYQVGELWEGHRISVAVEHLATAITERVMMIVQPQVFGGPARERSIIIACVADEYHQLGAKMVADLAEMHGWRGHFLGANTPIEGLLQMIELHKPDLLGLSLSVYCNLPALLRALDALAGAFPGLPTLVGGQALRPLWGGVAALRGYGDVLPVATLDQLEGELAGHPRV
jgi:MerR family transcriptional regulator, light-induced transcriptional regulator